jgi:hypothetical protein
LTVTFRNVHPDAPKGVWKGLNGIFMQPMGAFETTTHYHNTGIIDARLFGAGFSLLVPPKEL